MCAFPINSEMTLQIKGRANIKKKGYLSPKEFGVLAA
jgi:hypothetical protein